MKRLGKVRISALWDTLRTSYWFVPMLMAVASVVLWIILYHLDSRLEANISGSIGWMYTGGPDGARDVLSAIAASMMTVTGVVFSITLSR